MELSGKDRRHLRGMAHHLEPVMRIGARRVTEAVIKHVDELLEARELIKVKLLDADPDEVIEARDALVAATGADAVQTIGGTLVLFRRRAEDPEITLPGERPFARSAAREDARKKGPQPARKRPPAAKKRTPPGKRTRR